MIHGNNGDAIELGLSLPDGATDQYPRVRIYTDAGALDDTIDLTHVAYGFYKGTYTPGATGFFNAIVVVYTDAGHTVESTTYGRSGAILKIDEIETNINDILADTVTINWSDVTFIKDIEGGRWIREGTQMKFYKSDNVTLIATFNLLKADGTAAGESDDVFERVFV